MFTDDGYDPTDRLIDALNAEISSEEYLTYTNREDQFDALNNILSERRGLARKHMTSMAGGDPLLMDIESLLSE